ncbi:hypothetical protein [Methanosarcina horonobensis]|uniref:hypothetical protein n=1 Tax=Methanosarcina horonobensis TaxID=418008 RepID=UPI0022B8E048|nr:hypothetical protein [Methanosarcina horonobensis]
MEQLTFQNPNPVLRAGADGEITYSNPAGETLLNKWDIKVGEKLPHSIEDLIRRVITRNDPEKNGNQSWKKSVSTSLLSRT